MGGALAIGLSRRGYPVVAVSSQSKTSAVNLARTISGCQALSSNQEVAEAAELVFITTPDDAIAGAAAEIKWHPGQWVVHCSGADSTDILAGARQAGAAVGVFHPLQTFAGSQQALKNMPGTTFALEAEGPLLATLKKMAEVLGGRWIELRSEDKVIYHAAAVFACNYLVTLVKLAADLWRTFGIAPEPAVRALLPLLRGTINNIDTVGIPECLTGPIARGDAGTIKKHLSALQKMVPDLLSTYREL
ncbi:MAG: DUF2520 domain-containing protein, partial [Dehalococcoidales bacterium]